MFWPLLIAAALLFCSLLTYGLAIHVMVRAVTTLIRDRAASLGYWKTTAVMATVTLITAAAHLTQITLWAVAFLLCGLCSTFEAAFYFSAQNYTALGYGDVLLS